MLENDPNFKLIEYQGGRYTHIVPSRSGALTKDYNVQNYGMRSRGDRFLVHVSDIARDPQLFVVVEPAPVAEPDPAPAKVTKDLPIPKLTDSKKTGK